MTVQHLLITNMVSFLKPTQLLKETFMVYMVEATTRWAITIHVPMGYMESLAIVLHALIMVYLVLYMVAITEQAFMALLFQTIQVCLWETTMLAISVEKYMRLGQ